MYVFEYLCNVCALHGFLCYMFECVYACMHVGESVSAFVFALCVCMDGREPCAFLSVCACSLYVSRVI